MGSTTNFTVFNFGPYQSSTKTTSQETQAQHPPPTQGGVRGRKVNAHKGRRKRGDNAHLVQTRLEAKVWDRYT